jgi:hypothetical protein
VRWRMEGEVVVVRGGRWREQDSTTHCAMSSKKSFESSCMPQA